MTRACAHVPCTEDSSAKTSPRPTPLRLSGETDKQTLCISKVSYSNPRNKSTEGAEGGPRQRILRQQGSCNYAFEPGVARAHARFDRVIRKPQRSKSRLTVWDDDFGTAPPPFPSFLPPCPDALFVSPTWAGVTARAIILPQFPQWPATHRHLY